MQTIEEENALVMPAILPPSPILKSHLTSSCKRTINRCSFSISIKKCKFVYVKRSMKKVIFFLMTSNHRRNSQNHLLHNNHQVSQTRPIQQKQIAILHPPNRFSQWIRLYGKCKQKRSWKKKRCLPEFAWYNLCTTYIWWYDDFWGNVKLPDSKVSNHRVLDASATLIKEG